MGMPDEGWYNKGRNVQQRKGTCVMGARSETDLYAPVKQFLEDLGYEVKSEVHDCDVVAVRQDQADPVIVEFPPYTRGSRESACRIASILPWRCGMISGGRRRGNGRTPFGYAACSASD